MIARWLMMGFRECGFDLSWISFLLFLFMQSFLLSHSLSYFLSFIFPFLLMYLI